jgi:hypothetical protein
MQEVNKEIENKSRVEIEKVDMNNEEVSSKGIENKSEIRFKSGEVINKIECEIRKEEALVESLVEEYRYNSNCEAISENKKASNNECVFNDINAEVFCERFLLDAAVVVDEDEEINSKMIASRIEDVCNSQSLNNELCQSNERRVIHDKMSKDNNINNIMNVNNVENGVYDIRINSSIKKRLNYACSSDEKEEELCKSLVEENDSECTVVIISKVDDASHSLDDDKSKSNEREEVCKKSAELENNIVVYIYNNCNNKNENNEGNKMFLKRSLSLLLLKRVKITTPPATNQSNMLFSINTFFTSILKFIFETLIHQLNFKIFFEQLLVVKSITQLLPPPQPPPISNKINSIPFIPTLNMKYDNKYQLKQ